MVLENARRLLYYSTAPPPLASLDIRIVRKEVFSPSPLGRVPPKGAGEVRYNVISIAALRRIRTMAGPHLRLAKSRLRRLLAARACGRSDLASLGHLKVNCPEGAREAILGCPQRGRLWALPRRCFFCSRCRQSPNPGAVITWNERRIRSKNLLEVILCITTTASAATTVCGSSFC